MASFDPLQPPLVSETLLKNRRSVDELAYRRSLRAGTENKVLVMYCYFVIVFLCVLL